MNVGIPTIPRCLVRELLTLKCLSLSGPVMAFDVIVVIRKPDFPNWNVVTSELCDWLTAVSS